MKPMLSMHSSLCLSSCFQPKLQPRKILSGVLIWLVFAGLYLPPTVQAADWIDVSAHAQVAVSTPIRSRRSPDAHVKFNITNTGSEDLVGPLRLVIVGLTPTTVTLGGATGTTAEGDAYVDLGAYITTPIAPGETSTEFQLTFIGGGSTTFSFTDRLEQQQAELPSVVITQPETLITVGSTPIQVSGTINIPDGLLTVNGIPVQQNNGQFQASVALEEGLNTIIARLSDATGNEATDSIVVSMDMTAPYVTIESPSNGQTVNIPSIAVSGLINDIVRGTVSEADANVTVNGIAASVSNRSYLAQNIPLQEGPNTITVTGADQVGNVGTASITVNYQPLVGQRIELLSGQNQGGPIRSSLAAPLAVKLMDDADQPLVNKNVIFRVTQGDGIVGVGTADEGQATLVATDANGMAQTPFKLGSRAGNGNNRVRATSVGVAGEALFYASATALPGNKVSINSGNNQRGTAGQPLPQPFIVSVTDEGANVVEGTQIEFTVTTGGGKFHNGQTSYVATTDGDGRASTHLTLGPDGGYDNNRVTAILVGTAISAGFTASGLTSGDPGNTRISGVVFDNQDTPLPGVTVRVDGTTRQVQTDAQGQFLITEVPVGPVHLLVDGATTTVPGDWPTLSYNLVTVAGAENILPAPVYMVKLDTDHAVMVGLQDTELTLDEMPGFKLEVKANSVTFPDGSRSGLLSVTPVNTDKVPMPPPNGMQPQVIVTIQPTGTRFDPPAKLTLPNVDGHAPGAQVEMYSYDHDLEEFVAIGLGTVSPDGSLISSNPGVGVIKAGWHCGSQPGGQGCASNPGECQKCDGDCVIVPDDTKTPTSITDIAGDCRKPVCSGGGPALQSDNSDIPEDVPGDCKIPVCKNFAPDTENADDPPQDDKCKFCENGVVKDKDTGDWLNDDSFGASIVLPDTVKNKIQNAINKLPNVNITLKETKISAVGRVKDCCVPDTGNFIDKGLKEGEGKFEVSAALKNIKLWPAPGTPSIHVQEDLTAFGQIVEVQVVLDAGVFFDTDFVVEALGGKRINECKGDDCSYGSLTANIDLALFAQAQALACFDSTVTNEYCGESNITPANISTGVTGGVTYNIPECNSGIDGTFGIKPVVFSVNIKLGILPTFSWSEQIYPF